jgi:hypothetical protein
MHQTEASLYHVPFADLPNTSREQTTKTSLHKGVLIWCLSKVTLFRVF